MGQRLIRIGYETLARVLQLPDSAKIVAVSERLYFDWNELAIKVESPEFSDVEPGCCMPTVGPTYRKMDGRMEFVGWNGLGGPMTGTGAVSDGTYAEVAAKQLATLSPEMAAGSVADFAPPKPDAPAPVKFREFI